MLDYNYERYLQDIARSSGTVFWFKETNRNRGIEVNIKPLSGTISPFLSADQTKFSFTFFSSEKGRIVGIDNHEHKPLHLHSGGTESILTGSTLTIASAGSIALSAIKSCLSSY